MRKTVLALVLVLLSTALYAAEPVTAGLRAPEAQASPDQQKTPAARMPGVSGFVGASSSGKPPWEWSDEERIRVRFDPASIRERAAAHEAALPPYAHTQMQSTQTQSSQHIKAQSAEVPGSSQRIVDGSRDPGLFLPAELLDVLLEGLHPNASFRTHARVELANDIRGMGYTEDDFWDKLEQLSTPYRALTSRPSNLAVQHAKTPDGTMVSFLIDVDRCVARHNLLQSARTAFGAQAFQRFLYTAVAPEIWRSDATNRPDAGQQQKLLFVAGGCRQ